MGVRAVGNGETDTGEAIADYIGLRYILRCSHLTSTIHSPLANIRFVEPITTKYQYAILRLLALILSFSRGSGQVYLFDITCLWPSNNTD